MSETKSYNGRKAITIYVTPEMFNRIQGNANSLKHTKSSYLNGLLEDTVPEYICDTAVTLEEADTIYPENKEKFMTRMAGLKVANLLKAQELRELAKECEEGAISELEVSPVYY